MWVSHYRQGLRLSSLYQKPDVNRRSAALSSGRRLSDTRSRANIAAQHTFIMQGRYIVLSLHRWTPAGGAATREKLMNQLFNTPLRCSTPLCIKFAY
jgi:hypothetical protein